MFSALERRLLKLLLHRAERRDGLSEARSLGWMSRHDALTGLLNRNAFLEDVRRLRAAGSTGTLMMIDLDHFKLINDRHGHGAGDDVLRALAHRIQAQLPSNCVLARQGGDEFVVYVPVPLARGAELAARCVAAARVPIPLAEGGELATGITVGVASLPARVAIERVLAAADQAMYAAKEAGRDRVQIFDDETASIVGARRSLAAAVATLQAHNQALRQRVETDVLTGLHNRDALEPVLATLCGGPDGQWPASAVVFLDIDHFGDYNHHHGDDRGDEVLRKVAQAIRSAARQQDRVFRKGGEEIVAVLPNTSGDDARAAAERMRQAVAALGIAHAASPVAPVVTVTAGVASSTAQAGETVEQLLVRASGVAMRAKLANQRNRVHVA